MTREKLTAKALPLFQVVFNQELDKDEYIIDHQLAQFESLVQPTAEEIETWDFKASDTQYATHGVHTYLAALVPKLVEKLLVKYSPSDGTLLDPFCGGGAVMVEGILSGRTTFGGDLNPLAVLLSKVKSRYIARRELNQYYNSLWEAIVSDTIPSTEFPSEIHIQHWFKPYMFQPLSAIRRQVLNLDAPEYIQDFFKLVLSATVRDVMLTYRNEIRLRRLVGEKLEKFNPDILKGFETRYHLIANRVSNLPITAYATVQRHDARALQHDDNFFDTIITSPPYGDEKNGIPYIQFAKNMLYWLGFSHDEILQSRSASLGGRPLIESSVNLAVFRTLQACLTQMKKPTSIREAQAFYADYWQTLVEMARVTKRDGRVIVVVGNRILEAIPIDNAQITVEMFEAMDMPLEIRHVRKLPSKRLPQLRRNEAHGMGGAINVEHILVFKKPS